MRSVGHSPGVHGTRVPAALSPGNAPQYSGSGAARGPSRSYSPVPDRHMPCVPLGLGIAEAVS